MNAHLLAALAAATLLTACNGPLGPIPGGTLNGSETGTTSFAFAAEFDTLELQGMEPGRIIYRLEPRDGAVR